MLSRKAKRELKIDQRQVLIDSIEIGIPSPEQILIWGERDLPNGKKAGLVKNSKTVNYKRFTPFRDGLFCERIFGPVTSFVCACGKKQVHTKMAFCEKCEVQYTDQRSRRYRLGYISLLSPVTHIWYLKGRPSYLSLFLGKRKKTILALAYCNAYLVEHGISSKDKNNIKEKVSLGHYRSKICNAKQDLPLRQNIKAPNPFRQVLKTETKALKSFVKIRQLKNSSSSLNSFAHVSEKDSIGAQSFCQEATENIKANSFLRTSAPSLVTTDQRSVTQSKTCPYKSSICKGNIPTKPSFVRGMRKQDQEIQTGSLSYKKNFYIRQQSLPFLPSLVCNFYLRDAILDFVSSPPSSRDTPLFSYCNIKRWDVLRNVHKFMAQQSVSKFKKTPIVTQKQSFKTNSKNNLGFATRLSTLPSKVFASRTKAGSYPACLYTCKTGHRLSFISDKDLFKHKLLLTRLCKGLFPISYKTKPYKSKKTACKQVKSNTKNILGFASRHIFDARTGLALCYRSSISNDQDFHVQSKALQEDVTKSLKIARARPSFLKKKRVYKKTKSKQFFSLSDALLDYTTQAHKRMSLFYKAQANIQSFAQLVQAYKFTQKLSYCKQNTLRDKQKKDYLGQNNQAPAKTISLQKQAFLSSFYDLDYLAELEKRGSLSPKQINNFSLFQTEKSLYIKEGKVSSAFLYKAEFTNYSKSDQETQYINASINSLGCALERLNSFGVMDKLSVELSLRDDIRWREKWAVTSLSKTSKQVVQLLTKPKLVRKLFFDETKLCFGKANVFESSYKAELSSCAINRNVCLKKTKDNTCRQSLIRKNKNIALTNPIFLRTGFAKQSQGPKTSLSAYKNFSDNCKAYFRKTSNRGISFCYDQSVTRQKQDPQSNKKVCLFCPKGYVSLPKRSFVKGQLMPIFDKAQSQGCSTKNVMPFFTDRRSVTQSKASPKNETKKIRKIEQDFVPKSKTTPLVSGLELTAIREILSYTGGGALKQILQCFTIHSFEKFLFAETEILRNRYKKGILFFPNATPTDIPRLVPGSSFCGVTKHSKAMPLQIQNLNRQSDMSQGRVITDQRSVTQNKSKPSKKSTANDFLKAPFAAKAGDYESKICNAKQDQGNKAANALGEKQNLRSCALQVKQSCARQRVSHLWSMENKTTICKSLRQSFDLAKPMPAHLQRICPYKACAKQSFAKSDLRTPWKARQYKSSICKGKFINFNSKNFFQSKTSRSTTYPALYHVQKLNRTELAKDREQSLSLFAKQDFAQHNVCRHSIHTVSHTDTRKTKLSKNFTSLKSFANCKSQYQDLEKKSVVRFSRRIYKNSRRLKIVQLLTRNKRRPEWMILSHLPVLPPDLRPILQMSENLIVASDLNNLYQRVIYRNNRHYRLRFIDFHLVTAIQRLVQDAVDRLIENGKGSSKPYYTVGGRPLKSLSDTLKGKKGRFRLNLLGKRVDFSGRSVIVVSPSCKIHECGLPKDIALELYHYFLLRQLILRKHCSSIVIAKKMIKENSALILDILRDLIYHHPVLLNRAPTLHRLGIQAFQPKLVLGSAILLHPLVCSAFNADFDGDQMGVHLPLSFSARAESWDLLWSRNNLLSPATGQPMLIPSQDMVLGFYYMTALAPILYNPWPYKGKNSAQLMPCNAVFGKGRHTKNVCITKHKLLEENTSSCEKYAILPKDATLSTSSVFSKSLTKQRFSTTLKNFISSKESFLQERHLFSSIIEMIGFYQKGKIFLHTPVWLKWNGKIESDEYSQRPLELRINSFASSQYICPQYKRSSSYTKTNIFYPTHTSASKQATDERFHFDNLKNRASCINQSSLPSASTYTANTYTKNMEVNTSTICPAFAEHTKPGLGRPKDKTKETKQRLELLTSTDVVFTFRIFKAKQTNYVRTSVGRVLVNNILET